MIWGSFSRPIVVLSTGRQLGSEGGERPTTAASTPRSQCSSRLERQRGESEIRILQA